jgi:effector-associated domain 1 (EAD1)-containing protein
MPRHAPEGKMGAKLREAILAGFDPASLNQVLRDNDMLSANIVIGPDFATRVNSLIDVARQEGWLVELCGVLAEARAGNQRVNSAIVAVQKWLEDRHDSDEVDLQFQQVPRQPNVAAFVLIMVTTVTLIGVAVWVLVDRKEISTSGDRSPVITGTKGNVRIDMGNR